MKSYGRAMMPTLCLAAATVLVPGQDAWAEVEGPGQKLRPELMPKNATTLNPAMLTKRSGILDCTPAENQCIIAGAPNPLLNQSDPNIPGTKVPVAVNWEAEKAGGCYATS